MWEKTMGQAAMVKAGWIMTALVAVFLLAASVTPKLTGMPMAAESLEALGWPTRPCC
jgi:hypothetical protein